jgi:hypothetical protein
MHPQAPDCIQVKVLLLLQLVPLVKKSVADSSRLFSFVRALVDLFGYQFGDRQLGCMVLWLCRLLV